MGRFNFNEKEGLPIAEYEADNIAYEQGYHDAVDKACSVYGNELRQFKCLLNKVKEGAGELVDIDGSVDAFHKAMEE